MSGSRRREFRFGVSASAILGLLVSLLVATPATAEATGTGGLFVPSTARILDTAAGVGGFGTPMPAGRYRTVKVAGVDGIPDDGSVAAVSLVATASDISAEGQLVGRPSAEATRTMLGKYGGIDDLTTSFSAVLAVSDEGTIDLHAQTEVNLTIDVQGYYTSSTDGTAPGGFVPVNGKRIIDTRSGLGAPTAKIGAGQALDVHVTGLANAVPTGASGVIVNLLAVNTTADAGYLTPYPTGATRPATALHYQPQVNTSVQAQVGLSGNGTFTIHNTGATVDVIVDLQGYFTASGGQGASFTPGSGRVYDTRSTPTGWFAAGETRSIPVAGIAGVPTAASGVTAAVLTLTSLGTASGTGRAIVWADGTPQPNTTAISSGEHVMRSNTITVPVGTNGAISLQNLGNETHYILDLQGWYAGSLPEPQITSPVSGVTLSSNLPAIGGHGHPGATISVKAGSVDLCAAEVADDATWSCQPETPLSAGAVTINATETGAETNSLPAITAVVQAPRAEIACPQPHLNGSWTNTVPTTPITCVVSVHSEGHDAVTAEVAHNGVAVGDPLALEGVSATRKVAVPNVPGWHQLTVTTDGPDGPSAPTTFSFGLNDGAPSADVAIIQKANPEVFMDLAATTPGGGEVATVFTSAEGTTVAVPVDPANGIEVVTPTVEIADPKTGETRTAEGFDSTVGLPLADEATNAHSEDFGLSSYTSTSSTTSMPVVKADGSVQLVTILRDSNAPRRLEHELEIPAGAQLVQSEGGMVSIVDSDGVWLSGVAPAWAVDANGASLPTHYEVEGTTLVQVVQHDKNTAYPVVTDPFWVPLAIIALRVAVQVTVKVGARTVRYVPASATTVANALRTYTTLQFRTGAHVFKLDKSAMQHILTRHHPRYWDGSVKTTQTFLNPNMTVAGVRDLVHAAMKQWGNTLKVRGTGTTFTLSGTVQGVKYTLKISNGRVVQFYPRP